MKLLRFFWYILEFIVAGAIFIMLAQKTPLFERVIPGRNDSHIQTNSNNDQSDTKSDTKNTAITWDTLSGISLFTTSIASLRESKPMNLPVQGWLSCTTPRGEKIVEYQSVSAYKTPHWWTNNLCVAELRVCRKGKLSGTYQYKSCSFIVDGRRDNKDIVTWASQSQQQFVTESVKLQEYLATNQEYIQPKLTETTKPLSRNEVNPYPMDNAKIISHTSQGDTLDQSTLDLPTTNTGVYKSCRTPRGEKIDHGSSTYAYDIKKSDIHAICKIQTRSCQDGRLSGTYRYPSCNDKVSQYYISIQQPDYSVQLPIISFSTGIVSPWGPDKPRSLQEMSHSTFKTYYSNSASSDTSSPSQNYIDVENTCTTPRWTTLVHGESITAYRNSATERNSLCDSQVRTCRYGSLGWSFSYPSCLQENKKNKDSDKKSRRYQWTQYAWWILPRIFDL
jgi:hypothetical protein